VGDREACEGLLKQYRKPVVGFLQVRGFSEADAEDLAQEVMVRLVKALAGADKSKGRFRNLILGISRNLMRQEWDRRNRAAPTVSVDSPEDGAELPAGEQASDETFDGLWVDNLISMAMDKLRKECAARGTHHFEALDLYANRNASYEEISAKLGAGIQNVKSYIYMARQRLKKLVSEAVAEYSSRDEYEAELALLKKFLG
jgi:RNA polymerase sigma factor (sigma-70 family)